jgi:hypothetical protein
MTAKTLRALVDASAALQMAFCSTTDKCLRARILEINNEVIALLKVASDEATQPLVPQ